MLGMDTMLGADDTLGTDTMLGMDAMLETDAVLGMEPVLLAIRTDAMYMLCDSAGVCRDLAAVKEFGSGN